MLPGRRFPGRGWSAAAGLMLAALACSTITSAPASPAPASVVPPTLALEITATPSNDQVATAIQTTLDTYARAFNESDPDLLLQVVDQNNKPFRRSVQTRLDTYLKSFRAGAITWDFRAESIERRDAGFVQAHITTRSGLAADWLFQERDGQWWLSEPTVEQVGAEVVTEDDQFIFHTWPWADDINAATLDLMFQARERVKEKLGKVPDEAADVYILPIYGLRPNETPQALAWYSPPRSQIDKDNMTILAAHSFAFGLYDPRVGWEQELLQTMVHEYTHMTHLRSFGKAGKLSDWVSEGLAEWVSDSFRYNEVAAAVQSNHIIPIVDTTRTINKQDLNHLSLLTQDVSLAYGLAASLVKYTVEEHGGLDGFWKLAQAYDQTSDFPEAVPVAFGITYEQFDRDWRAWLEANYH